MGDAQNIVPSSGTVKWVN